MLIDIKRVFIEIADEDTGALPKEAISWQILLQFAEFTFSFSGNCGYHKIFSMILSR